MASRVWLGPPLLLVTLSILACSGNSPPTGGTPSGTPGTAPAECGPGTMPSLERGACANVGPAVVPNGFQRDADGFRISAIGPAKPCANGTMARPGETTCVAVDDDCARPFPPPNATWVVSPGKTPSGNVVGTLAAALERAKRGEVVALDEGEYDTFDQYTPITLVGRCASRVVLRPSTTHPKGVRFIGRGTFTLSNVTIRGAGIGLRVGPTDAKAVAERVFFDHNDIGASADEGGHIVIRASSVVGVGVAGGTVTIGVAATKGSRMEFEDGVISGHASGAYAVDPDSHTTVRRSSIRGRTDTAKDAMEAFATAGALVEIEESSVTGRGILGAAEAGTRSDTKKPGPPARLRITKSELSQTDRVGGALVAREGARIELEDASLSHVADTGVTVVGGELSLVRSVIVSDPAEAPWRQAVQGVRAARVTAEDSAFLGAQQLGLSCVGPGSSLSLTRSLVAGTRYRDAEPLSVEGDGGRAVDVGDHATLAMVASAVVGAEGTGVYVGQDAVATLDRTLIDTAASVAGSKRPTGNGLVIEDARCSAERVLVRRCQGSAVAFLGGDALVKSSRLVDNAVGVSAAAPSHVLEVDREPIEFTVGRLVLFASSLDNNAQRVR